MWDFVASVSVSYVCDGIFWAVVVTDLYTVAYKLNMIIQNGRDKKANWYRPQKHTLVRLQTLVLVGLKWTVARFKYECQADWIPLQKQEAVDRSGYSG